MSNPRTSNTHLSIWRICVELVFGKFLVNCSGPLKNFPMFILFPQSQKTRPQKHSLEFNSFLFSYVLWEQNLLKLISKFRHVMCFPMSLLTQKPKVAAASQNSWLQYRVVIQCYKTTSHSQHGESHALSSTMWKFINFKNFHPLWLEETVA